MLTPDSYPSPSTAKGAATSGSAIKPGQTTGPVAGNVVVAATDRNPGQREPMQRETPPLGPSGVLIGVSELGSLDQFDQLPEGMPALRILVVDDDAPVRKACCEIVLGMGFVPLWAASVPEARALLKQQPVDMLLLDLKLPGGGGLKLLQEVKALYPETGVVVMTAFATVSSAVEAMRIGAGDYLTKPFALED